MKQGLLALTSTVVCLAMAEVGVRLLLPPVSRENFTAVPGTILKKSPFEEARYVLRRNGTATQEFGSDPRGYFDEGATLTYRTNSLGFRGPETTRKPAEGVHRIIGFGDSFTFGTGVRLEHTFLYRVEQILNKRREGLRHEVLNFGVPGWATLAEVALLRESGVKFEPDTVLIVFFLNDTGGATRSLFFDLAEENEPGWLRQNVRIADMTMHALEQREQVREQIESYRSAFADDSVAWLAAKKALRAAHRMSEEHRFKLHLIVFPVMWNLGEYPFVDIHRTVEDFARQEGIPFLDLLPAFTDHDGPELWVHPNNQHPNEIGHEIAAEAIAEYLLRQ